MPVYLSNSISIFIPTREGLRSSMDILHLDVPRSNRQYGLRSFSQFGPSLWNKVPLAIRTSPTDTVFKKKLKTQRTLYLANYVKLFLLTTGIGILAFNEIRLDDVIDNDELLIPGYVLYRKDRNRSGGGVAMYVCDNHASHMINMQNGDIEFPWVKIELPHKNNFIVGAAYRSEEMVNKQYFFECLEQQINGVSSSSKDIYLIGDFNLDSLKNGFAAPFKHLCYLFQFKQLMSLQESLQHQSRVLI